MKTFKQKAYIYAILYTDGSVGYKKSDLPGMDNSGWYLIEEIEEEIAIPSLDYRALIIEREEAALMKQRDQLDLKLQGIKDGR